MAVRCEGRRQMRLGVSSSAFSHASEVPRKYTCDGQNTAPPLQWSGIPTQSKSVAVICDDPDAPSGTFTYWVLYNVPASTRALKEGASIGTAGVNSFGTSGFGG